METNGKPEDLKFTCGLDLSSSKFGCTILINGVIFECFGVKFDTKDDLYGRVEQFKEFIFENISERYPQIKKIYVEDYLRKFTPGKSSAKSIFTLASMNNMCSYMLKSEFKIETVPVAAATARKMVLGTIPKNRGGKDIKEYVYDELMSQNKEAKKVIEDHVSEMKKQNKRLKKKMPDLIYDITDSMVIALSAWKLENA